MKYYLICGTRRLSAYKKLGYQTIPTMVDGGLKEIPLNEITIPQNPRLHKDKELSRLMNDIKNRGLLQPIVATIHKHNQTFFLSNGTAENLHRKNLSPFELGKVCDSYYQDGCNDKETASILNIPPNRVKRALRIYNQVPEEIHQHIEFSAGRIDEGKISFSTASSLAKELSIWDVNLNKEDLLNLWNFFRMYRIGSLETKLIVLMIKSGIPINKLKDERRKYAVKTIRFVVRKIELEKYEDPLPEVIESIVNGEREPNKKLIIGRE